MPHTVVVHLKRPFAPFVNTFFAESDQPYDIVPAHVLAKYHDINDVPFDAAPHRIGRTVSLRSVAARRPHRARCEPEVL